MRDIETERAATARHASGGSTPRRGRAAKRGIRVPMWLHALLLALAPVLVFGFYSVVDGAVDRAAARRAAAPAARASVVPLRPVVWECTALPGGGPHNACRPVPSADLHGGGVRVPAVKG